MGLVDSLVRWTEGLVSEKSQAMTEEQKAKLEELSVIGRTLAGLRPAVRRAPRETENSAE